MSERRFVHADIYADHAALLEELARMKGERDALKSSLDQVDDVLVVNWVGPRKDGDYKRALADLVTFNIQIHDDPQVSEVAAKRQQQNAALREGLQALVSELNDKRAWLAFKLVTAAAHVSGGEGPGGWCAIQIPDWDVKQKIVSVEEVLASVNALLGKEADGQALKEGENV